MKGTEIWDLIKEAMDSMTLDKIEEWLESVEKIKEFAAKASGKIYYLENSEVKTTLDADVVPDGVPVLDIQSAGPYVDVILQVAHPFIPMVVQSKRFETGEKSSDSGEE